MILTYMCMYVFESYNNASQLNYYSTAQFRLTYLIRVQSTCVHMSTQVQISFSSHILIEFSEELTQAL